MSPRMVRAADFRRRPWYVRGLNKALTVWPPASLQKDDLLRAARRRTGLRDVGEGIWEEALDRLLRSIRAEARLHPLGRIMVRAQILGRLEQRLWAEYWFQKHPEILEQEVYPIWLITGLQRTGTTKLQRLLATDPHNRSLRSWEAMFPAPVSPDWLKSDRRLAKTRRAAQALGWLAPKFQAIHPIVPEQPEEDVLLLDLSFLSTTWEAMLHVPAFAAWLEGQDQTPGYAYELKLLKLLQWQDQVRAGSKGERAEQRRWILKSPHHLEWLDVVCGTLPVVQIIRTHRDPQECIPSWLSMLAHGRAMFSDEVDVEVIKAHWLRKDQRMLARGTAFGEKNQGPKVVDVDYSQLVKDIKSTLSGLYRATDIPFSGSLPHADGQPRSRHLYTLQDFGLTSADISRVFNGSTR